MVYIKHMVMSLGLNTWGFVLYNNVLSLMIAPFFWFLTGKNFEVSNAINSSSGSLFELNAFLAVSLSQDIINYFSIVDRILVSQWCIKPLCDILMCHNPRIVIVCLEGLENIGEADKNVSGVNLFAQIENLQSHDNIEIYEKAVRILETYWLEKDDETMPAGEGFNFGGSEVPSVPTGGFNFN